MSDDYKEYQYTSAYVFDALNASDQLEIILKTPFGKLGNDVISYLNKYGIQVEMVKDCSRNRQYKITRFIDDIEDGTNNDE